MSGGRDGLRAHEELALRLGNRMKLSVSTHGDEAQPPCDTTMHRSLQGSLHSNFYSGLTSPQNVRDQPARF